MKTFPSDFITELNKNPVKEILLAIIKLDSGNVYLSDLPIGITDGLDNDYLPYVESWGTEQDESAIESFLNPGNLEAKSQKISLIRTDQTKAVIDQIINEGIHNKRFELYRWLSGMTSPPQLIDTFFCQDPIVLTEDSLLFSFDIVSCTMSENPAIWQRQNQNEVFPVAVGRATAVPLQLLEDNPPHTEILESIDETYLGPVKVKDLAGFPVSGTILINSEYITFSSRTATVIKLSARAQSGSDAQEHDRGSGVFPSGSVYKFGGCAGPVGVLENLRSGDTDYSGDNAVLRPDTNPARVEFNDRLPYLYEDQDMTVTDKAVYGSGVDFSTTSAVLPYHINKDNGLAKISIPFRDFGLPSTEKWYKDTVCSLPALSGGETYAASENISTTDYFTVSQSHGVYDEFNHGINATAYREFKINPTCPESEVAWTMIEPEFPENEEFTGYSGVCYWSILMSVKAASYMQVKMDLLHVYPSGAESLFYTTTWGTVTGEVLIEDTGQSSILSGYSVDTKNHRIKMQFTLLSKGDIGEPSAYIRIGGPTVYSDKMIYGLAFFWQYYVNEPAAHIASIFSENLSGSGVFTSAKASIKGVIKNSGDKAQGVLNILDNGLVKYSTSMTNNQAIDQEISLDAISWLELATTEIRVEVNLSSLDGEVTAGSAGFDFDGGIVFLLSYTSSTIDGQQIRYTTSLTVDAIAVYGENPTPAEKFKWLVDNYTSYSDFIDIDYFAARSAEYATKNHYLNGLIPGNYTLQDAYRKILKEGFARLRYSSGKIELLNYITDSNETLSKTYDNDYFVIKKKGYKTTATNQLITRLVINYDKVNKTGISDGQFILDSGGSESREQIIDLDLVSEPSVVLEVGNYLFGYKSVPLKIYTFEAVLWAIASEKGDIINVPNIINNDIGIDTLVISAGVRYSQGKNDLITIINFSCLST